MARALERAKRLGCTAFQVFSSPPRNWLLPSLDNRRALKEFELVERAGLRLVFHAPYLVNLSSPDEALRAKSVEAVLYGMRLSDLAGGAPLVVHAGTAVDGKVDEAYSRLEYSLSEVARRAPPGGKFVFELTAGAGKPLACELEHIPRLVETAQALSSVEICLDSQHLWAAGYDWQAPDAARKLVQCLEDLGCASLLACLHLNDSRSERGSRLDRHANLGAGKIGLGPLVEILRFPLIRQIPVILETPGSDQVRADEFGRLRAAAAKVRKFPRR